MLNSNARKREGNDIMISLLIGLLAGLLIGVFLGGTVVAILSMEESDPIENNKKEDDKWHLSSLNFGVAY